MASGMATLRVAAGGCAGGSRRSHRGGAACRHDDCVMAVAFHPVDSRHFVSCSWNGKVRLQCASPARVVDWKQVQLHEALPIHCVRFNSRGSCVTVGALQGRVRHFKVPPSLKLEYHAEIGARFDCNARRRALVPCHAMARLPVNSPPSAAKCSCLERAAQVEGVRDHDLDT